jgi:prepilin-type N-terminal cleavage/methylation domain-containing protein
MSRSRRRGFSLLEVLLAMGILIGSSIVLMELASIGMRHAASARDLSQAQLICQTKLNEIVAGVSPAETVRPMPWEDDPRWTYWVTVQPTEREGLTLLEVGVAQELIPNKQTNRFTLVRWIRTAQEPDDASPPIPGSSAAGVVAQGGLAP